MAKNPINLLPPGMAKRTSSLSLLAFLWAIAVLEGCGDKTGFNAATDPKDERSRASETSGETVADSVASGDATGAISEPGEDTDPVIEPRTREFTFETDAVQSDELRLDATYNAIETEVTLKNQTVASTANFQQPDYPMISETFKQGTPGQAYNESFTQNAGSGLLDIQIVIDNSGSMGEEQVNLGTKLMSLLDAIKDSNWRINIVTTDPADGCSRKLITKLDDNGSPRGMQFIQDEFQIGINAGTGGASKEQGIRMARAGLACVATPWVRQNSTIAVLIISDENNCSNGTDCPFNANPDLNYRDPVHLTKYLTVDLGRTLSVNARAYGIFWHPELETCGAAESTGSKYAELVEATGGTWGKICDDDYSGTLLKISQDVATILKTQFSLSAEPDPGSLVVKVNNVVKTTGFSVSGSTLTFTQIPPEGAVIAVSYSSGAKPMVTAHTLAQVPVPGSVNVKVNGTSQAATAFTVNATLKKVDFVTAIPANATVVIDYKKDVTLQSEFTIGTDAETGSVAAKVGGVQKTGLTYSKATGKVLFQDAPPAGSAIEITYRRIVGPILEYPVAFEGTGVTNITVLDKSSGNEVAATFTGGTMTVPSGIFTAGKVLTVKYENDSSGIIAVQLPQDPMPGSVVIDTMEEGCQLGENVQLEGRSLVFACDLPPGESVIVMYQWRDEPRKQFALPADAVFPGARLQVFIGDSATTAYFLTGSIVTLKNQPPASTKIRIVVSDPAES